MAQRKAFPSKYAGLCATCGDRFVPGTMVAWSYQPRGWSHDTCPMHQDTAVKVLGRIGAIAEEASIIEVEPLPWYDDPTFTLATHTVPVPVPGIAAWLDLADHRVVRPARTPAPVVTAPVATPKRILGAF